jgi:hypothetical protein
VGEARSVAKGFADAEARGGGAWFFRHCLRALFAFSSRGDRWGMLCRDQTMDILLLHKQGRSIARSAGSLATPATVAIQCVGPCARAHPENFKPRRTAQNSILSRIISGSDSRSTASPGCV